jgi:hypothetical protein
MGSALYDLYMATKEAGLNSVKLDSFTHDSCTADVKFYELVGYLKLIDKVIIKDLRERFLNNFWIRVDLELFAESEGSVHGITLKEFAFDNDNNLLIKKASGSEIALDEFKRKVENSGFLLEDLKTETAEEILIETNELFQLKRVFPIDIGKKYKILNFSCKLNFLNL